MLGPESLSREPLFIDLETRSAADLPKVGGWNYAAHASTHLLTVAWSPAAGEFHIWFPWHDDIRADYLDAQGTTATIHHGREIPEELAGEVYRPWCAHNAWNFDSLVWKAVMGEMYQPVDWIDTEPLARAISLPGGLDAIGQRLWGVGKYKPAKAALKKHMYGLEYGDATNVPPGIMPMLAEYNVQDVVLLRGVWEEVVKWCRMPQSEWDILNAHRDINHRGAPIDTDLLNALVELTDEGKVCAVKHIADLTRGQGKDALLTINDLQSRNKVFAWLDAIGVSLSKKPSLRKELVQQFINTHTTAAEDAEDEQEDLGLDDSLGGSEASEQRKDAERTMLAVRVLQLRGSALRITGGKLAAASSAVCADGRVRGLFVYWGAHTGRWAGRRIQPHNFARPKDGIKSWDFIDAYELSRFVCTNPRLPYEEVDRRLPDREDKRYRYLTPDDAASALVRSIFGVPESNSWRVDDDPTGLLAADFSNIEARVLAWLAGETWLMEAFTAGLDPYVPMAEAVFGPSRNWSAVAGGPKKHPYRQVGKVIELGCGYSLGGMKMDVYAAANGIDLAAQGTSGPECVLAYRKKHPAIAGTIAGEYEGVPYFRDGFWHKLNDAAIAACRCRGQEFAVGVGAKVTFVCEGPHMMCYLPSGRRLIYRNANVEKVQPKYLAGSEKTIDAVVFMHARFGKAGGQLYGGKIAENVVQASSRDFLAHSIVSLERADLPVVLHVHDEPVSENGRLSDRPRFMTAVTTKPDWAPNFPLDAEGGWSPRYSKSPPPGDRYKEELWRDGKYVKPA